MDQPFNTPVIGFYGFSGSGKTSLIYTIIQELEKENIRVGVIKRTDKAISSEPPGKDTAGYRAAGAIVTSFLSASETNFVTSHPLNLLKIIDTLRSLEQVDVIIIEGALEPEVPKIRIGDVPVREKTLFTYTGDFKVCMQEIKEIISSEKKGQK